MLVLTTHKARILCQTLTLAFLISWIGLPSQANQLDQYPNRQYRIRNNDLIEILVQDAPELSGTYLVCANGAFTMPYIGRINAQQKTIRQLAQIVEDNLRGRYLKDPKVTIEVKQRKQWHSDTVSKADVFYIAGEVYAPGSFQLKEGATLRQAISLAEGMTSKANGQGIIFRHDSASNKRRPIEVNLTEIMRGHKNDKIILPKDLIVVLNSRMKLRGKMFERLFIERCLTKRSTGAAQAHFL